MNNRLFSLFTKKRIALLLFVTLVMLLFYGLLTHAFVEITVSGKDQGLDNYLTIKNQSNQKIISSKIKGTSYKKLLPTGVYEITVKNSTQSYYKIVSIGRLFTTSTVPVFYTSENKRDFIGDNPRSCLETVNQVLVSVGCVDKLSNIAVHKPATDTVPTYLVKPRFESGLGVVEGLIKEDTGRVIALVRKGLGGLDYYDTSQIFYEVGVTNNTPNIKVAKSSTLNPSTTYLLTKKGSRIYLTNEGLSEIYIGDTIDSLAKLENVPTPKDSSLVLTGVSLVGKSTLATYEKTPPSLTNQNKLSEKSEIVIVGDDTQKKSFGESFVKVDFCNDKICALTHNGILKLYDLNLKFLSSLTGVRDFYRYKDIVFVVDKQGVLNLNTSELSGFYSYSFGSYSYEGLVFEPNGNYIIRVNNGKKSYALAIDTTIEEVSFIDRNLDIIINNSFVNTVSVYKNHIFISPELGELVSTAGSNTLDYTQRSKDSAKNSIEKAIGESHIDKTKYKIVVNGL